MLELEPFSQTELHKLTWPRWFVFFFFGKLPITLMNYQVLAICPHELPSTTLDPLKLLNPSQQPPSVSQLH
jgi:hypothetical protein